MKKFFRFIAEILPIVLIALAIFAYWKKFEPWYGWCNRQRNRVVGTYNIYLGDKALEKSREPDANIAKELTKAVKFYNKGLRAFPEHHQARCNLAGIYVLFEDYSSAMEQYKIALRYKPDYLECRKDLGILEAEELSMYDDAIDQFSMVTSSKRKSKYIPLIYNEVDSTKENKINAYYNTGLSYRGKTMFLPSEKLRDNKYMKEAVIAYNKSVEAYNKANKSKLKRKDNYDMLFNLALAHHYLGNTKEAGLNYCKAIKSAPLNYEAHLNLGILLDSIKEYDEAITEFTKAGMLIDAGDYQTVMYLNDLLNDSYKKNAIMKEINAPRKTEYQQNEQKKSFWQRFIKDKKSKNEKIQEESTIIIKDGKVKLKFPSESEFNKNLKKCESEKIFKEML